ncbi:hypothetical protein JHK84_042753 [Glycine max]|nr:hypothetical protein JHK84_042753 [Glycine max]
MVNVALLCVQYKPDSRPIMSDVVKMLEDTSGSSVVVTDSSIVHATPTMRNMPLDKPQVRVDCGPMLLDGIFYT